MKKGVIIGAGIGGLTTAMALAKRGITVEIYEQAPEIKEVGAGIWVAPNGLKVYQELGIAKDIIAAGKLLEKISVVDLKYKLISVIDGKRIEAKHQFKTVAIHRATLQKILASYIHPENINLNKKFKAYQHSDNSIIAAFEDGTTVEADFLIIADGIKSNGRLQIHPQLDLRYSGQTCWRFVSDIDLPRVEEDNMYEIWANRKGLRVGYSKINERAVYVFITNFEKAGGKDSLGTVKEYLLSLCADFPGIVKQMIASVHPKEILRTDLFDFKPISHWVDRRAVLIGDAAHATTPNLGQGACQAIEDAYVIVQQLTSTRDVETAFKDFQQKRFKKAKFITNTSWQFAQMTNTSGLKKSIVKGILKMTPNFINEKQLDKIYSLDY